MWSRWWFKLSSPETQREKKPCNHQELLLRQVHLRIGFSILCVREVFRSQFRLQSSDTGSSGLTSIGSEGKAVTVQDFHFKNNATVCLPTAGQRAEQEQDAEGSFVFITFCFFMITLLHGLSQLLNSHRSGQGLFASTLLLYNSKQILPRLETFVFSAH